MKRLLAILLALAACSDPVITEGEQFVGIEVDAATLERGRLVYLRNCAVCHGESGTGRGPSAAFMWPPPRDFTAAKFKFAGIQDRGLPADAELARIITEGLAGTAMRAWDLEGDDLVAVIQYLKTFSPDGEGFRSERLEIKPPEIPPDPYTEPAERAAAIARGEKLYHSMFQCASCHPSYATAEQYAAWDAQPRAVAPLSPAPKWSPTYRSVLVPPDFLRHPLRAVRTTVDGATLEHDAADLYRSIAYGLQGPMPGYGHLGAADVWAVAHYVKSLADLRDSTAGWDLARRLRQ